MNDPNVILIPHGPGKGENAQRALVTPATGIALAPRANGASRPFQFGEVIQPDWDCIGRARRERGRLQLCINRDQLSILVQHGGDAGASTWKMGRWVCRRPQPRDLHRVVRTKFGWRVERRVPQGGPWHELGHCFGDMPVLFPSSDVAIAAAEIMIGGATLEFGYLIWLMPRYTDRDGW